MSGRVELRPHQREAVAAGVNALSGTRHAAVTIIAACGTGKTLIGKRVAEHFAERGPVLVLVPTLELLTQTAARWLADGGFDQLIGVCSLSAVHDRSLRGRLLLTGNAQVLARRVAGGGRIAVFATYASLPTIAEAHRSERLPPWAFALADEAHRTSGSWDKRWALIHDDRAVPAAHRLYMTATPRNWRTTRKPKGRTRIERLASMDDPTIYGPVVYNLDLAQAIERGILADYQLIVPEVHDSMLRDILHTPLPTPHQDGLRLAAMQAALLMSMAEHDARRVLSFHGRIAAARGFVASLPETADVLADRTGIRNPWAQALHCRQAPWRRQQIFHEFEHFSAHTPGSTAAGHDCAVLSSVRVLSEGVDAPATDGILIADPRRSPNHIAQVIGRALRQPPGQAKCASIFIPVYIAPGQSTSEAMKSSSFSDFWCFFNGLAIYDTEAYQRFAPRTKARPQPLAPRPHRAAEVTRTLRLRTHKSPNNAFWKDGLEAAQAFHARHRHLNVPSEHVTSDGLALGQWIGQQRSLYAADALPADRIAALTSMGLSWPHPPESFEHHLTQITACAARHGTLALGKNAHGGDRRLAAWLETMRRRADTGQLAPARIASLNAIDPFWNPPWSLRWQYTYAQIRRRLTTSTWRCTYHRHDSRDSAWDSWLDRQITHSHHLEPQQKHLLAALARACPDAHPHIMLLTRPTGLRERAFNRGLRAARQYHQRHGHLDMPKDHTEEVVGDHKIHLGAWLVRRRRDSAQMTPRQQAGLAALGFETMPVFLPPAQAFPDAA